MSLQLIPGAVGPGCRPIAAVFVLLMLALSVGCGERNRSVTLHGSTMGTTYSVVLPSPPADRELSALQQRIDALLDEVNGLMSTYRPDSELSRFNASRSTDWMPVSPELVRVVAVGDAISRASGGRFDVTVGPLVNLWGFGPEVKSDQLPSRADIEAARSHTGYGKLKYREDPPALRKQDPVLYVDLSAIAKGHGVDRVAERLDSLGFTAYFVEIGGEVRCRGRKLDGSAWQVGIERPAEDERSLQRVVPLTDRALATSGNYRNYFEESGQRYAHTLDPRSGQPIQDSIASASVLADTCALADGIATGMMAAGFEKGLELAEQHGWSVMLLRPQAEGEFEVAQSSAFAREIPAASD